MKILVLSLILFYNAFAITPFSLENISSVNVKILNKQKLLSEKKEEELTKKIEKRLNQAGIKTDSKSFSNFLIKVKGVEIADETVCLITLFLVEDVLITRQNPTKAIATTYSKDDFFQTDSPEDDIVESIEFLLEEFISQYQEEN